MAVAEGRSLEFVAVRSCNIYDILVGPAYSVSDWLQDGDRDLRKLFYKITTKVGLGEHVDSAVKDRFYASSFLVGADRGPGRLVEAPGLGLAHLLDGVAASLASDPLWCRPTVDICHVWLDGEEHEHTEDVEVVNVAQLADVVVVADKLYRQWQDDMKGRQGATGDGIRSIAKVFRHLAFGMDVEEQLGRLAADARRVIWNKLMEFDGAVREWRRGGATTPSLPGVRSEGTATMDQFGESRIHRNRHGTERVYKLHVSAGSCRIHFRVERKEKVVEVGYVGRHLPTKKFH